jgi:hypothetical protein
METLKEPTAPHSGPKYPAELLQRGLSEAQVFGMLLGYAFLCMLLGYAFLGMLLGYALFCML